MYAKPADALAGTPQGRDAAALLRNCVHCGFCLPACPTYRVTGSELDSPRGRIYLVKQLVEGGATGEATRVHLERCLTCRACETACPSGVQYGRLVDIGRELSQQRAPLPERQRLFNAALAYGLSRRSVFGALLRAARWLRPVLPPALRARVPRSEPAAARWPAPRHARRMAVLDGCVQPALAPGINLAAARVLDRIGVSLVRVRDETCCGALDHHLGHAARAVQLARRNVESYCAMLDAGAEAIVSTTSGCGVMIKDYAHLLRDDPVHAGRARRVAEATRDLSEVITPSDLRRAGLAGTTGASVAWQSPCTLQHGQRVTGSVEALLTTTGCRLTHVPEAQACCGSAGTYSILQPALSREIRARKLASLMQGAPDVIATANIGCLAHLREVSAVPVRHWIEIVAGGV